MPHLMRFLIFCALPLTCWAQLIPFANVEHTGEAKIEPMTFAWQHNGAQVVLKDDGTLLVNAKVQLKLPREAGFRPGYSIEKVTVGNFENELLIAYDTDSAGDGYSYICRIEKKIKSVRWCQEIRFNFNVSTGSDSIWVGAIGLIGRIEPKKGKYIWRTAELYGAYSLNGDSFNVTCPVAEDQSTVTFDSNGGNANSGKRIVLDRANGKILSVVDIKGAYACR